MIVVLEAHNIGVQMTQRIFDRDGCHDFYEDEDDDNDGVNDFNLTGDIPRFMPTNRNWIFGY